MATDFSTSEAPPAAPDNLIVTVETPAHLRQVVLKEYTFTCKQCGQTVTLWRYPGRPPTLCSPECSRAFVAERDRESNRERQRRFRERRKGRGG